jgi:hypothetical protein
MSAWDKENGDSARSAENVLNMAPDMPQKEKEIQQAIIDKYKSDRLKKAREIAQAFPDADMSKILGPNNTSGGNRPSGDVDRNNPLLQS